MEKRKDEEEESMNTVKAHHTWGGKHGEVWEQGSKLEPEPGNEHI